MIIIFTQPCTGFCPDVKDKRECEQVNVSVNIPYPKRQFVGCCDKLKLNGGTCLQYVLSDLEFYFKRSMCLRNKHRNWQNLSTNFVLKQNKGQNQRNVYKCVRFWSKVKSFHEFKKALLFVFVISTLFQPVFFNIFLFLDRNKQKVIVAPLSERWSSRLTLYFLYKTETALSLQKRIN